MILEKKKPQIKSNNDTAVMQTMAKVAMIEPCSIDFCKLPAREKCWKAKYPAINKETIAPCWVPLSIKYK